MYRLYDYLPSGNGYKVRLVLKQLALPYELIELDIRTGATRTVDFLNKNPNGRIPLLEIPGKGFLPESHAIIAFLADGTRLIPTDAFERARMWQWMCFEQYNLEPNIATLRFWTGWVGPDKLSDAQRLQVPLKREAGNAALKLMNDHLRDRVWFVGNAMSLADVCLFAYTHVADGGGFDLGPYPAVLEWIERIKGQPGYLAMDA